MIKTTINMTQEVITHIERAIGIKLNDSQIKYLLSNGDINILSGRGSGKTVAHCILLALSDGPPLDLRMPWKFSDYGNGTRKYAEYYYKKEFLRYRKALQDYGLPVRDIRE